MKNLLSYTAALLGIALALGGCAKATFNYEPEPEEEPKIPTPEISVKQPETYPANSGTYSVDYTIADAREGVKLEASSEDGWITGVTADDKTVTFSLTENTSTEERSGSISLAYQDAKTIKLSIKQAGKQALTALDVSGTANCYIVSAAGTYKFAAVKGNSTESVGEAAKAEVLWETFGTATAPQKGELISEVTIENDAVVFKTPDEYKEGNALIAVKDASDNILWSWHIWLTDKPEDQVYKFNAGTMMDRNLGATSATPGEHGTLGLYYEWGRKDPFMGRVKPAEEEYAKSTLDPWPDKVYCNEEIGTIEYATAHPTTFIESGGKGPLDWIFETNNDLWKSEKTMYDPCPPGYRIPDGGPNGIWAKAFGGDCEMGFVGKGYDEIHHGYDFGEKGPEYKLSDSPTCWYPIAGVELEGDGYNHQKSFYWSCDYEFALNSYWYSYVFEISESYIYPIDSYPRNTLASVRCRKE